MAATPTCAPASARSGCRYVAGILPQTSVWAPGTGPLPPKKWSGHGRPPKLIRRDDKHQPISVKQLALGLPKTRLAHDQVAGGYGRVAVLALCARARSCRASRLQSHRRPAGRVAADRVAKGRGRADQILALDASRRHRLPPLWSTSPSCAGASSATIRNSSRRSGSGISKGADGAASITTPRCASQPTDS